MTKTYKPGQSAPASCQVEIVGPRGGRTHQERTVVLNQTLPPTPKPGQQYIVVDRTKNNAGQER